MRTGMKRAGWAIALAMLACSLQLGAVSAQVIVIDCDTATPGSSITVVESGTPVTEFEGDTVFACDDDPALDSSIHITPWECDAVDFASDLGALLSRCDPNTKDMTFSLRDIGSLFDNVQLEGGLPNELSFDLPNTGYVHVVSFTLDPANVGERVFCAELPEATPSVAGSLAAFEEMPLEGHFLIFDNGVSESPDTPVHLDCHWFLFFE